MDHSAMKWRTKVLLACCLLQDPPYMNGLWLTLLIIPAALILVLGLVVTRVYRSRRTMKLTKEPQLEISSPNVIRANTTGGSQELQMSFESPEDEMPAGCNREVKDNGAHNGVTAVVSWTRYNSFKKEEENKEEEEEEEEEDENEDSIHLPLLQCGSSPALTDSRSNSEHVHQVKEEQSEVSIDPDNSTCHLVTEEINDESDEDEDEYVEMHGNILLEEDNDSSDSYEVM
ncbi:major centromere autoantigen B-like isoform X2 [Polypterus senegalus]|uniref:major centromere autoantigen B-like isoform X2 n=1 Tax=Polypterus senegalus TaxID=55291 RepID=UPI0019626786|nr:major centromere autoantigen B-like isoform X2 [Polypterus senegalus]